MKKKSNTQAPLRPASGRQARHIRNQKVKGSPAKPKKLTKRQLAELAELAAQQDAENSVDLQKAAQNIAATGGIEPHSQRPMNRLSLKQVEQYAKAWAWERYDNLRGYPDSADAFMRTLRHEITETNPKWRKWLEETKSTIVKLRLNPDITAASLGVRKLVRKYETERQEQARVITTEHGDRETDQKIVAVAPKLGAAREAAENMAAFLQPDVTRGKAAKTGRSKGAESTSEKAQRNHADIVDAFRRIARENGYTTAKKMNGHKGWIQERVYEHFNGKLIEQKDGAITKTVFKPHRKKGFSLRVIKAATARL